MTRNLVFVINSLAGGGAERVLSKLLYEIEPSLSDFSVHLILLDREDERQPVPAYVERHVLDARFSMAKSISKLTSLLRTLSPALVISFLNRSNCASIIASKIVGFPCLVSERVHTTSHFGSSLGGRLNRLIVRLAYRHAAGVIAVSEGVKEDLRDNYGVPEDRIRVVYNPVDVESIRAKANQGDRPYADSYIIGIGRLMPNKNFPMLIRAYASSGLQSRMVIVGEGPERTVLESLVAKLGLEGRVVMPGYDSNPYRLLKHAEMYVSASNAEGFPNALVEAMSVGCPVVVTDCDSGPKEILQGDMGPKVARLTEARFGLLSPTEDSDALAEGMRRMAAPDIRSRYADLASRRAQDFGADRFTGAFRELITAHVTPDRKA